MFKKFFNRIQQKVVRFVLPGLLVATFVLTPVSHSGTWQKAQALEPVTVIGGVGTVQQTLTAASTAITAGLQNAFFIKEFTLDGIFHGLAKLVLKSMTRSIITWINSGFEGKPAFVTDLRQYVRDRVDESIGEFIYNDPSLNFLCSPFQLDVKIALALSYQQNVHEGFGEAQCTLSDVTENVEGFLNGSFSEGGWPAWFELTQNPINTPTGAYLAAEAEMYARIVDEQGNTVKELDWGQGFLSFKVCDQADKASGAQKDCDITTPGSVIANQINKSLGAGQDELIAADEINEIISALFAQLAQRALTGLNGLLGLGASSYSDNSYGSSGNRSFLDALAEESATTSEQSMLANPFISALENEEENITLQTQIVSLIDGLEADITSNRALYGSCFTTTLTPSLINARDEATLSIASSTQNIIELAVLEDEFSSASSPADQLPPVQAFQALQADGSLTGVVDNKQTELYIRYELTSEVDTLNTRIEDKARACARES